MRESVKIKKKPLQLNLHIMFFFTIYLHLHNYILTCIGVCVCVWMFVSVCVGGGNFNIHISCINAQEQYNLHAMFIRLKWSSFAFDCIIFSLGKWKMQRNYAKRMEWGIHRNCYGILACFNQITQAVECSDQLAGDY